MNKIDFRQSHSFLVIGDFEYDTIKKDLKIAAGDDKVLEGATAKIEELRELIRWLSLKPLANQEKSFKLVLIKDVDKIGLESVNTILKTLEEPPPYAKIILTTLNEQKVLGTIQSRCQKIRTIVNLKNGLSSDYSHEKIQRLDIKEKFDLASRIADLDKSEIERILVSWQVYFREKMLKGNKKIKELQQILRANDLIVTNVSPKLLLENLILNL
jgi:hypothetical protein